MARKLASVRKIAEIRPIEKADAIEAVRVDGWWVVAKKGEFKVDDLCVYFEIDSFLPVREEFEFLRKACFKSTQHLGDGFRLKTIRLRGQLSQGLVLPIVDFTQEITIKGHFVEEGLDLTEVLGVKLYEKPISPQLAGSARGNFPSFIRKTDQERVQNCYGQLKRYHEDTEFYATLKLDGSSMTVYLNDGVFGVCSRNIDLKETEGNTFWKVARALKLEEAMRSLGRNIAVQGELMGPGVQGNRENLTDHDLYVFDIWDIDTQSYETPFEMEDTISDLEAHGSGYKIAKVPILGLEKILQNDIDTILKKSSIGSLVHPVAEGIVYRSVSDGNVSFKAINNEYLLGEK